MPQIFAPRDGARLIALAESRPESRHREAMGRVAQPKSESGSGLEMRGACARYTRERMCALRLVVAAIM
jgi:hypothetical protein